MVRCADTPGSPGGPGTGADAAPATPVQDVTPTDDPRPVGITCDSDTEEIPTIIVGSDEVDSESDDEEAVGTPAEGAADTQVSAPAKKKQTKKDREKAEKQAHRIQSLNVVPDMGTVQIDRLLYAGEASGPRGEAAKLDSSSRALAYYDLFWSPHTRTKLCQATNAYAGVMGAGTEECAPDWKPFSQWEFDRSLGFLIHQGLDPKPRWMMHMEDPNVVGSFGTEQCRRLYGNKNAVHRFQEFRTFFHIENYSRKGDIGDKKCAEGKKMAKIWWLSEHTRKRSEQLWQFGQNGSIDEMTIGFQGRCSLKL